MHTIVVQNGVVNILVKIGHYWVACLISLLDMACRPHRSARWALSTSGSGMQARQMGLIYIWARHACHTGQADGPYLHLGQACMPHRPGRGPYLHLGRACKPHRSGRWALSRSGSGMQATHVREMGLMYIWVGHASHTGQADGPYLHLGRACKPHRSVRWALSTSGPGMQATQVRQMGLIYIWPGHASHTGQGDGPYLHLGQACKPHRSGRWALSTSEPSMQATQVRQMGLIYI